jgi:hypothetical protein
MHSGSLRRLLVFSWGHRTQRWINWRERCLSHLLFAAPGRTAGTADGFDGSTRNLKTESEPSLRLLALTYGGSLSKRKK